MKKKILVALVGVTLVLSLLLSILPGCGGGTTPTATQPTATTPGATTPGATQPTATTPGKTTAPPPAKAGEVIKWRWQTGSQAGAPTYWLQQEFAKNVKTVTNGQFEIEIFPAGAIVGTTELFDAAIAGSVEMTGPLCDCNWSGKGMRFEIAGQGAGMFTPIVNVCWMWYGTPDQYWGEYYTKTHQRLWNEFGVHHIPFAHFFGEAEYVANKPLIKAADFKGVTFRGTGWSAKTAQAMGAKGVFIPNTDVYSALQTGVIDAAELGNVWSNLQQGYYDIVKYTGFPGIHKLSETSSLSVNQKIWDKLPDNCKKAIEVCAAWYALRSIAVNHVESAKIIGSGELQKKGVTVTYSSPDMQELWRKTSWDLMDAEAAKDPKVKEDWEMHKQFQIMMDRYIDLMTPNYGPTYEGRKENIPGIKW